MTSRTIRHSVLPLAGGLLLAACGGGTEPSASDPSASIAFATGRTVVDVGATAPTALSVRDAGGTVLPGIPLTFTSRDPSIATVDAGGTITGVAKGQAVVVASVTGSPAVADSLLAVVATPGGPVLYTSLAGFTVGPAATITVSVYLDMRGSARQLASGQLDVRFTPAQLTYMATSSLRFAPEINATAAGAGLVRLSFADPKGVVGPSIEIARLTFTAASAAGTAGALSLEASELTASDYSDLLASTIQVAQPLVLR